MVVITSSINAINPLQLIIKRLMDIVLSIIGTIITIFLSVIIGPMIFFKSKGPIFFVQDRVGKNGAGCGL
jgi:lipopolysaccharide/colanic/teichoic acid biosynthesis glycosyltransferase